MAPRLPNFGPRTRKVARYLGLVLVGIVTFVFALQLTFPFGRIKDQLIELLSDKYDVKIGDVEGGFMPGRVYFKAVSLRTRPTKADEVATTFYIDQLQVDLGLLALLRTTAAVKLDAKIGAGHLRGDIELAKDHTSIDVTGEDLPSGNLPVREVLGLPMRGKLRFAFALELPNEKSKSGKVAANWLKAEGNLELACPANCVIGDGKSKLRLNVKNQRQQAMVEGGIDFGTLNIASLLVTAELKNGKLELTKFDAKSGDGDLHIDFNMVLNQDLGLSVVAGCLRFRGSDALLKREPKTHSAITTTGGPLGPDNLFHIKLEGPANEIRRLGVVCGPSQGNDRPSARPNLTLTPEPNHPSLPPPNIPGPNVPAPNVPAAPLQYTAPQGPPGSGTEPPHMPITTVPDEPNPAIGSDGQMVIPPASPGAGP